MKFVKRYRRAQVYSNLVKKAVPLPKSKKPGHQGDLQMHPKIYLKNFSHVNIRFHTPSIRKAFVFKFPSYRPFEIVQIVLLKHIRAILGITPYF